MELHPATVQAIIAHVKAGWTGKQLADAMGIDPATLNRALQAAYSQQSR